MPDPNDPDNYGPDHRLNPKDPLKDAVDPVDDLDDLAGASGGLSDPSEVVDDSKPSPIEPMEDGLEEDEPSEDDPPEEEKPPVKKTSRRVPIKLPGAKGPLEVDSIGDYLEDADWTQIDEDSRNKANKAREQQQELAAGQQQEEQGKLAQRQLASDNRKKAKADRRARRSESTADDAGSVRGEVSGMEGQTLSEVTGDTGPVEDNAYYSTPTQDSIVPVGPPASPEHLQGQKDFNYDFGSQGSTSFNIPGQASTAKEDAVEKATDAINTATSRVVDMLEGLAQVMNNHSNRIAQLEDTLDMESERDG